MAIEKFQDFINKYETALLEIIPDFYKEKDINNFTFESPDERKSYFTELKFSTDFGYYIKEDKGYIITDEAHSALKEPYIKQQKKWKRKCSDFAKEIRNVLSFIDHPNLPLFRFRFFNKNDRDKYLEDDLDDETGLSIFVCFISFLVGLRAKGKTVHTAKRIIKEKMKEQAGKYQQKYKEEIKSSEKSLKEQKRKLKRGEKRCYVDKKELVGFIEKSLKYFKTKKDGELKGASLARRITQDINNKFKEELEEKNKRYKESTIKKMISEIRTGEK